jgi:hypothetical protein
MLLITVQKIIMIKKFVLFNIVILIIFSFVLSDNLESRAESIINKNTLDIEKPSPLIVNEAENDRILSGTINNNTPAFEGFYDVLGEDGFNTGQIIGYWTGENIRAYLCNKLNLGCDNRSENRK